MGQISIQNVACQLGHRMVLSGAAAELHSGEIVGIVGPNGCGKTTLLRLIMGEIQPDSGTITRSRGMEVGYLSQEPSLAPDRTLHDEVLSAFAEVLSLEQRMHALSERIAAQHDGPDAAALLSEYDRLTSQFIAAGGYTYERRLREILGGLGFAESDHGLPVRVLSGGQKCRAALARLLLQDSTYLLLDEPTNHLDIDAVRWLEKFLAGHHGGAAIISHDRYLLDRVAQRILEIDRGAIRAYPGNYTNFARTRERNRLTQERRYDQDRAFIEKERDFIARHMAGQRSKEARGRRTRLQRQIEAGELVLERPGQRRSFSLEFGWESADAGGPLAHAGRTVIETAAVSKAYGARVLFSELSVQIGGTTRMGITGPNGTGKTTLLKVLLGQVEADGGTVRVDPRAAIGYYAQESSGLDENSTVLQSVLDARPGMAEPQARSLLGHFLFSGEDVFKRIGQLSGGEQSRVRLIRLMLAAPSVLVLDEPTNHLDIPSREALEAALEAFPGAILAVSHDRYFLDRIVTRLLVLRDGRHETSEGNYSDYVRRLEAAAAGAEAESSAGGKPRSENRGPRPAKSASARPGRGQADKRSLAELEARIHELQEIIRKQQELFADPAVYREKGRIESLRTEFERCQAELEELEAAWFERAEREDRTAS